MGKIYSESWAYYTRSFLVIFLICALIEALGYFFDSAGTASGSFVGYTLVLYYMNRDLLLGETNLSVKGGLFGRKGRADNKGMFKFMLIALFIMGLTFLVFVGLVFTIIGAGVDPTLGSIILMPFALPIFFLALALLGPLLAAAVVQDKELTIARSMAKFGRASWQMLLGPMPLGFIIIVLTLVVGVIVARGLGEDQMAIYAAVSSTISTVLYFFPIIMAVRVVCGIYRELRPIPMDNVFV